MRLTLSDLLPNTQYVAQFRAVSGDVKSEWSRAFYFTTTYDARRPDDPNNVSFVVDKDNFVAEWDAVTTAEDGTATKIDRYEMELVVTGPGVTKYIPVSASSADIGRVRYVLTYDENKTIFGTARSSISMRVRAINAAGVSSLWTTAITVSNPTPSAPASLTANALTNAVELSWVASTSDDVVSYNIYTGTPGFTPAAGNRIFSGNTTRTTYATTTYSTQEFRVFAVDRFGQESTTSASAQATPLSPFVVDVAAPAIPTGLAISLANNSDGATSFGNISWSAVTGDTSLAGYIVRYRVAGSSNNWTEISSSKDNTALRVELPVPSTAYEAAVRSFDWSANYSGWSSVVTSNTPANPVPSTVTGLVSTPGKDSITYSWTPVSDTDLKDYEVTVSTSSTFASGNITFKTGTASSLTVGGLSPNTTYYARVRAVDRAGQPSAAWTATDTDTTGTFPSTSLSDSQVPATPGTPNISGGLSYLYATWAPVTTNAIGGSQLDPITYEVHLGTATGFTTSAATKVTEVAGTSAVIDILPGTTTPLSYGTNYYVRLIAKDRDGSSGVSATSAAAQISKVASTDVTSIGADLIVPGTGIIANLVINTGGGVQSSNYSANTAGWRISPTGAEFNDSGSSIKADAIKAGTLGGSGGSGVINIAAGTSLIFNGGYLKSNTYTGTSQATNPSGAGFYLGNDGLRIDSGIISASALTAGTISGTNTITLSGPNAKIVGTGFELSGSGLTVTSGTIASAAITVTSTFANSVGASMTTIDGGIIKTGSIQSQTNTTVNGSSVPVWSIPTNGAATFAGMQVLGNTVLGNSPTDNTSMVSSSNYIAGTAGWQLRGDGTADLLGLSAGSISGESISVGTLKPNRISDSGDPVSSDYAPLDSVIRVEGTLAAYGEMGEFVGLSGDGFTVVGPHEAAVTNRALSGNTVTLTTAIAHGYDVGGTINVTDVGPVGSSYNGKWVVASVPTTTTLTYTVPGSPTAEASTSSTGTVQGKDVTNSRAQPINVNFPTDGAKPNIISGTTQATTLVVSKAAELGGTTSIPSGAVMTIASAITAPVSAPTLGATYNARTMLGIPAGYVVYGISNGPTAGSVYVLSQQLGGATTIKITEHNLSTGSLIATRYTGSPMNFGSGGYRSSTVNGLAYSSGYFYISMYGGGGSVGYGVYVQPVTAVTTGTGVGGTWFGITTGFNNSLFTSATIGYDNTANAITVAGQNSSSTFVWRLTIGSGGAVTSAGTSTAIGNSWGSGFGVYLRGPFNGTGSDVLLLKTTIVNAASSIYKNYKVLNASTSAEITNSAFVPADSSSIADAYYDASTGDIYDITASGGIVRQYRGGDSFTTSVTKTKWVAYSWYDAAGTTHETTLSPRVSYELPNRATLSVTVAPIPRGQGGADDPTKARIYVASQSTDPGAGSTAFKNRATIDWPGTSSQVDPYNVAGSTTVPKTTNEFAGISNIGTLQTTSGLSFWKGDDSAQFYQLVVTSGTDANLNAGNKPALRIGNTAGEHLRIDGNEILQMANDTTQGPLKLNLGGQVVFGVKTWQTGTVSIPGGTADTVTSLDVTYPTAFTGTPFVLLSNNSALGAGVRLGTWPTNMTSTGFTANAMRSNTGATNLRWLAIDIS